MPAYKHYQILKKEEGLEKPKKIGACLTCKYWDVPRERHESQVPLVARCIHRTLKQYQLLVSGGSACNRWAEYTNNAPDAKEYAERYKEA